MGAATLGFPPLSGGLITDMVPSLFLDNDAHGLPVEHVMAFPSQIVHYFFIIHFGIASDCVW